MSIETVSSKIGSNSFPPRACAWLKERVRESKAGHLSLVDFACDYYIGVSGLENLTSQLES